MGLSPTISEIVILVENLKKFHTPLVFCIPTEWIPVGIGIGAGGQKTRMMWPLGRERSLTIS